MAYRKNVNSRGFTIVELLVVIVVIGILAAITIVSYTGITQKAAVAALQSDLENASKKLKMYYTLYDSYPTALDESNCPTAPSADINYCLPISSSNPISYNGSTNAFSLVETDSTTYYKVTDDMQPTVTDSADYGLVGHWKFDENVGTSTVDSSGNGSNGTLSGSSGIIGDFENTLDGFGLGCGGLPTSQYISGASGQGLEIWSTGGDGLACMHKSIGARTAGYTVWFYGKGYISGMLYNGSTVSKLVRVDNGCVGSYNVCNGGNPYNDWTLFKLVATSDFSGGNIYFYDGPGASSEVNSSSYDFITDTPGFIPGKVGQAISMDGIDDYVNLGNNSVLNVTKFSIAFWYRIPEVVDKNYETVFNLPGVSNTKFDSSGHLWASTTGRTMGVHNPSINTWYYVALTNDGSNYRSYVDGVLTSTWSCSQGVWSTANFYLGGAGQFNGDLDDLRLYNRVMSIDEVKALYDLMK